MIVSADVLRQHLDYNAWATMRLLNAATELEPAELTRNFGTADRSIAGTLAHVFAAERVWLERVQEAPSGIRHVRPAEEAFADVARDWPVLHEQWRQWAAKLTDADSARVVDYADLSGRPWRNAICDIVLHVVNHSTHHRGQTAGFLRALGKKPPVLDLIAYVRELSAPAREAGT